MSGTAVVTESAPMLDTLPGLTTETAEEERRSGFKREAVPEIDASCGAGPLARSFFPWPSSPSGWGHGPHAEPAPGIDKTALYGLLGVLGIILFATIESLVSEVIEARLSLPDMVGAAVSGALVAGIVLPLRGRFSSGVSRLLSGFVSALVRRHHGRP